MELPSVVGRLMPVCSPVWGDWLLREQVSSMGTSAGWGGLQQCPHGCSPMGGGSANSRWGWDLGILSRSLEKGADVCCGAPQLGELVMQGTESCGGTAGRKGPAEAERL